MTAFCLLGLVEDDVSHPTASFPTATTSQAYRYFHGKSSDELYFGLPPAQILEPKPTFPGQQGWNTRIFEKLFLRTVT